MPNTCSVRMTSFGPRSKKVAILEKLYAIAVELCIQLLVIEGRSPLSLTMSIPQ